MSTVRSNNDSCAPVKAEFSKLTQNRTLRIDMATETYDDLFQTFVPLLNGCPLDAPFWLSISNKGCDARELGSWTMRYVSDKEAKTSRSTADCNKIRKTIWHAVSELLLQQDLPEVLPNVIITEACPQQAGRRGIIDLVFPASVNVWAYQTVLNGLDTLLIKESDDELHKYGLTAWTNSLPGSILPLDCHGLPVEELDARSLFEALKVLAAPAGSLLGFGKAVTQSKKWKVTNSFSGITRAYVELHHKNVSLPWTEFVQLLPNAFRCNGVMYSLQFPGANLHKAQVISTNFSVSSLAKEAGASGTNKRCSAAADEAESSRAATKKRRSET